MFMTTSILDMRTFTVILLLYSKVCMTMWTGGRQCGMAGCADNQWISQIRYKSGQQYNRARFGCGTVVGCVNPPIIFQEERQPCYQNQYTSCDNHPCAYQGDSIFNFFRSRAQLNNLY